MDAVTKIPPQSIEAEESLLSAALLDSAQAVCELIAPNEFYRTAHQKIMQAIVDIVNLGGTPDLVATSTHLRNKSQLEEVGGAAYLSRLTGTIPSTAPLWQYAMIVRECAQKREIIRICAETSILAYNGMKPVEILDKSQTELLKIETDGDKKTGAHISSVIHDTVELIEKRSAQKNIVTGVPTGFKKLDMMTAGWQPGDFIILAARPSMGKTALAWQLAENAAMAGTPVLICELEMTKEQLGMRAVSGRARIDFSRIRIGMVNGQHDWGGIMDASSEISSLPITIDDQSNISMFDVRKKLRKAMRESGCGLILLDYIQLMKIDGNKPRENEIGGISRQFKSIAKEFMIPFICLSQLNRKVEERSDKRPMLSDLRDSGSLEQDADVVAFIYRDEVYNKDENNPNKGAAELIIAKQRNGPIGVVPLTFLGPYMRFENPE